MFSAKFVLVRRALGFYCIQCYSDPHLNHVTATKSLFIRKMSPKLQITTRKQKLYHTIYTNYNPAIHLAIHDSAVITSMYYGDPRVNSP